MHQSYVGTHYKTTASGNIAQRVVNAIALPQVSQEKQDFDQGYKEGRVLRAHADRFMTLTAQGLGLFSEAEKQIVWAVDGDYITRQPVSLDWVDQLLTDERG